MKLALVLALVSGCDLVYSLDRPPVDAAPAIDIPVPDEMVVDAAPCVLESTPAVEAIADTMLLDAGGNTNPATRYGGSAIVNLGQGGSSRVIARFTLSAFMLELLGADDGRLRGTTLTVTLRPNDCPGGCTNRATNFDVFPATNEWTEGTTAIYTGAAWYARMQNGNPDPGRLDWQTPGANGLMDRAPAALGTAEVADFPPGGVMSFNMDLAPAALAAMRARKSGSELSLIFVPTLGGTLFLSAREDIAAATTLSFSYCP